MRRPRREGLARNAALVLGNHPREGGAVALKRAVENDPDAVVRATAFWSLARGHARDAGILRVLDAAVAREPDPSASADMARSLEER